jgi:hypothetical protein
MLKKCIRRPKKDYRDGYGVFHPFKIGRNFEGNVKAFDGIFDDFYAGSI